MNFSFNKSFPAPDRVKLPGTSFLSVFSSQLSKLIKHQNSNQLAENTQINQQNSEIITLTNQLNQ